MKRILLYNERQKRTAASTCITEYSVKKTLCKWDVWHRASQQHIGIEYHYRMI